MKKVKSVFAKRILIFLGTLSVVLAILGMFLPLLPTTPLLLLSAYLYSKSSDKFYNKLLNHKNLGPYIKNFRDGKGIPLKTKIFSILTIIIVMSITIVYFLEILWLKILLALIGLSISIFLISLKTLKT